MFFQRLLPLLALLGMIDICLAACHCSSAAQATNVGGQCIDKCNGHFGSIEAGFCRTGCTNWEQSHNCVPRNKRSIAITEEKRDETAELVEGLIERNAIEDLIFERDVEDTEAPDAALDLSSCLGSCTAVYNGATICRNNVGSLVGHAFYFACVYACHKAYNN